MFNQTTKKLLPLAGPIGRLFEQVLKGCWRPWRTEPSHLLGLV